MARYANDSGNLNATTLTACRHPCAVEISMNEAFPPPSSRRFSVQHTSPPGTDCRSQSAGQRCNAFNESGTGFRAGGNRPFRDTDFASNLQQSVRVYRNPGADHSSSDGLSARLMDVRDGLDAQPMEWKLASPKRRNRTGRLRLASQQNGNRRFHRWQQATLSLERAPNRDGSQPSSCEKPVWPVMRDRKCLVRWSESCRARLATDASVARNCQCSPLHSSVLTHWNLRCGWASMKPTSAFVSSVAACNFEDEALLAGAEASPRDIEQLRHQLQQDLGAAITPSEPHFIELDHRRNARPQQGLNRG